MSDFLAKKFYYNTVQEWLLALSIIAGTFIIAKLLMWFSNRVLKKLTAQSKTRLDDLIIDMVEEPLVFGLSILGIYIGMEQLEFPVSFQEFLIKVYHVLITLSVTWLIARTIDALIREYIVPLVEKSESDLDDQMLPIVRRSLRFIVWTLGIVVALNNAGYNVGALVAGLGIGGLAVAMAAKDSLSNLFGGVTILTDKPFKLGDRVKINGYDGFITEIGIRSTRLRTLEGRVVSIPNAKFTDSFIENVSSEPSRKVVLNLGLTYDTKPENMQKAIDVLKDIHSTNENLEENNLISFTSFGDFSLGILFIYYIKAEADIFQTQTEVNLEILKRFNNEGLEFAFPTQTIFNIRQEA